MAIHINSIIITAEEENTRLDRYLVNSLNVPQSLIQKDLRKGLIKVNDKKSTANYRVQETDIIQLFKDYSGKITIKKNLDDILNHSNLFESRPLLVHRLDKDTSGILIFALNRKYAKHFSDLFRDRKIEKTYEAIVIGEPDQNEGLITNDIQEDENTYKAETRYKIIRRLSGGLTHIELKPSTGRKHQLRIHCKLNGFPILGDNKYYLPVSKVYKNENNLFLHAKKIKFNDLTGELIDVEADLPNHFFNYI